MDAGCDVANFLHMAHILSPFDEVNFIRKAYSSSTSRKYMERK